MRNFAWMTLALLGALALAGCAGSQSTNTPAPSGGGETYEVKVMKNHALNSKTRTIKADLVQGVQTVGTGTFTLSKSDPQTATQVFSKTVSAGEVQVKAYEGSNPVGVKSFNPRQCPKPLEIELHVVDEAVHVYSNCD